MTDWLRPRTVVEEYEEKKEGIIQLKYKIRYVLYVIQYIR